MCARDPSRLCRIGLEKDSLLRRQQLRRAEDLARTRSVLGRHVVRVRAVGALRRQREHLRAQGGEHALGRLCGLSGDIHRGVHALQVFAHRRQRWKVDLPAKTLDHRLMAHAQPEHEPPRERLGDGLPAPGHRHRVASVDLRDAGADRDAVRPLEEEGGVHERISADGVRDPDGAVPELLELGRDLACPRDGLEVEGERPDADPAEVHQ
jgi:hypothetical protein